MRALLVAAALMLVALARPAYADPAPTPTDTPAVDQPGPTQDQDSDRPGTTGEPGMVGSFNITDRYGNPLDHYDITADEGDWKAWDTKILLFVTDGIFGLVRLTVALEVWLLEWAFGFGPAVALHPPAHHAATAFQEGVINPLGLPGVLLMLAGLWCGILILRGRTARGAGELAITLLIAAAAGFVLVKPGTSQADYQPADLLLGTPGKDGTIHGGLLGHTRDTAMALASITGSGGKSNDTEPGKVAAPLKNILVDTFVRQPHQMINYGEIIETGACKKVYEDIVAEGPWGSDNQVRDLLEGTPGCQKYAVYNRDPTWDRLLGTVLLLGAVQIIGILILLMVGALLVAVFGLAIYVIALPFALVFALLPGGGRGVLWRWIGGVIKIVMVIFAAVVFLPLFATFIGAILQAQSKDPLIVRLFLVDIAALAGLVFHRKLIGIGARTGFRIARRMEISRYGGTRGLGRGGGGLGGYGYGGYGGYGTMNSGWMGSGDPSGVSPISASAIARGARQEIGRITGPVKAGGVRLARAWKGSPAASAAATKALPKGAGALQHKLAASRGGRTIRTTGKLAWTAGKLGFAATLGAPVSVPRAISAGKKLASARGVQLKQKLGAYAAQKTAQATRYGDQWTRNTGLRHFAARATAATLTLEQPPKPPPPKTAPPVHGPAPLPGQTPSQAAAQAAAQLRARMAATRGKPPPPSDGPRPPGRGGRR